MKNRIPRSFLEQLLSRIDLVDLIDARVPLRKKSASNYFACCPFHTEKSASFCVSQTKQFYYCFGCGAHGNAIDFLIQYDHQPFPEAVETLAKQAGLEIPREMGKTENTINHQPLYELLEKIAVYYQTQLRQNKFAIEYLKQRGISGVIAKEFGLGFAPSGWDHVLQEFGKLTGAKQQLQDTGMLIKKEENNSNSQSHYDRFRERIMFPIRDRRGRMIGFGGRILEKGDPKYLNSPETAIFQKGRELYGLYQALHANRQLTRVLIVEGYMDVIALFQHEITYAVGTMGTATTANHLQTLFRHTPEIIFCFDGDNAGRTAAWRALLVTLPLMRDGIQVRFMFLPEGEDPDTLIRKEGKKQFEQRMLDAPTLSHFFFQSISNQTDVNTMDGRARFVKLATDHLQQLPASIFQQMMFEELAKKARIDVAQLTHPKPIKSFSNTQKARPPSTLRLAMTLLIQQPQLASVITEPLPQIDIAGFDLFLNLLEFIQQRQEITTGALLENWRDSPESAVLAKLAQVEHMIPETGIENEFLGSIKRLRKIANEHAIENLLSKAAQNSLTQEEKQHLQELIDNKK